MSARPVDSVFGVPGRPSDARSDAPGSDIADHRDADAPVRAQATETEVEWTTAELQSIAGTIEELQGRLEQANTRLTSAAKVETTECEIGRLFVEAQRFSEESLSKLELQIHEVLCAAETKANEILTEATEEAQDIRRKAQQAAIASTRTARELHSAIAGFTVVNNELVKELGALNAMLTPTDERGVAELDPSAGMSESD
jgi:cell division septum initiation protein DivIVA